MNKANLKAVRIFKPFQKYTVGTGHQFFGEAGDQEGVVWEKIRTVTTISRHIWAFTPPFLLFIQCVVYVVFAAYACDIVT